MAREPHPAEELRRLQAGLRGGLARGYVLRGEESWYRRSALELLLATARERSHEISRHDAGDAQFDLQALHGDLLGRSLFGDARCIVLNQPAELFKKQGRAESPAFALACSTMLLDRLLQRENTELAEGASFRRFCSWRARCLRAGGNGLGGLDVAVGCRSTGRSAYRCSDDPRPRLPAPGCANANSHAEHPIKGGARLRV